MVYSLPARRQQQLRRWAPGRLLSASSLSRWWDRRSEPASLRLSLCLPVVAVVCAFGANQSLLLNSFRHTRMAFKDTDDKIIGTGQSWPADRLDDDALPAKPARCCRCSRPSHLLLVVKRQMEGNFCSPFSFVGRMAALILLAKGACETGREGVRGGPTVANTQAKRAPVCGPARVCWT